MNNNENRKETTFLDEEQLEKVSGGGSILGEMVTCSWCGNSVKVGLFSTMANHKKTACPKRDEHQGEDPNVN